MEQDVQIALGMLQLIALLFPAIGLVLEALAAAQRDRAPAIWGERAFVLLQVSFVALSLAAIVIFVYLAWIGLSPFLLVSMVFVVGAMALLSYALFAMSGLSLYQLVQEILGQER